MSEKARSYFARQGVSPTQGTFDRIPELKPLRDRAIAIFGLGCLGAPSALEFARAGISELRILDNDIVDPGTTVRWPLGIPYAGKAKVQVIADFIQMNYPHTKVEGRHALKHRIGSIRPASEAVQVPSEKKVIADLTDEISLIYDATAEIGVNHYLSDFAKSQGIPYICLSATMGGWGGVVCRIPANTNRCWSCFKHAEMSGDIPTYPSHDETGSVQPAGCADPTFTGAGFDMSTVALTAVRVATSLLCHGDEGGYPDYPWDITTIELRDAAGELMVPKFAGYKLKDLPKCPDCSKGAQ